MRKKECIEWPPCKRPYQPAVRNGEDYGHKKPYIHYQLRSQLIMSEGHDVLNIDIFNGYALAARYFADRETGSHAALIMETGEWKKMILQNVVNVCAGLQVSWQNDGWCCGYFDYEKYVYASDEDKKRVNQYISGKPGGYHYSLESWESELQRRRRERQLQNKRDRINLMLDNLTPPAPEDFYRWMHEDVFGKKYLFQRKDAEKGNVVCVCNACMKKWRQKKAVGIGRKACPKCGAAVQGTYRDEERAGETLFLLQPCREPGKWIERVFRANCTFSPKQDTFVELDEQIRIVVEKGLSWGECYYEDYIDGDGQPVFWNTNHNNLHIRAGYLYPGTIRDCAGVWTEKLRNAGLQILANRLVKANYNNILTTWHHRPWFEYLVKGGFNKLVRETAASPYDDSSKTRRLNERGKTIQEVFRLSPGRIDRLRQEDGGYKMLDWLQYEESLGQKITQENMTFLTRSFWPDQSDVWKALSYVRSANVLANYVRRQAKEMKTSPSGVMNEWMDYLDMAAKLGMNLSHEMFYKPKNLKEAHDRCVRESQLEKNRIRAQGIIAKFPDVEKNMDAIRSKYTYDGEEYCIRVPEGVADIIHEGRALGHCIDSTDRYFDRINQNISYLVFLRRKETPTVPWYTLEIEPGGTIRQQRTTGNNQNKDDVAMYTPFIREWQEVIRKRMTEHDKEQAKASKAVRLAEYQELRDKKEKVWHGKLAGKLLADVLEADLIENAI